MLTKWLGRQGFTALHAPSGGAGLALADARNHPKVVDMTIARLRRDLAGAGRVLVLPDRSGMELGTRLKQAKPRIEVSYMSGYTDNQDVRDILSRPENRFLQKPFTAKALLTQVQKALS
ncbi:MAG TPA: hypothetical protein DEB40_14590 [Elusimicrobia bacterium]|nr:hypothetical protein [Elusimicrobiota bacterium]HBT62962.1 hypothetical protein [Elusimicrobiota bacterium]